MILAYKKIKHHQVSHTWFPNAILISSRGCNDHFASESSNSKIVQHFPRWRNRKKSAIPDSPGYSSPSWWNRPYNNTRCHGWTLLDWTINSKTGYQSYPGRRHSIHVAPSEISVSTSRSKQSLWKPYLESAWRNLFKPKSDERYLQSWTKSKIC